MQIRQLEESLGVALLRRHSRGVDPTSAGVRLHERAIEILALVERTTKEVAGSDVDRSESIRLGLTPALMPILGPEIAVQARERTAQVFLSLAERLSHMTIEMLLRGDLDLALAYDAPDLATLVRQPLLREHLVLVTLPGPGSDGPVSFAEAMEQTLVLPEAGDAVRDLVTRTAESNGLEPNVGFSVRSVPAMRNLILRGAAAGILPMAAVADEVRAGRLAARRIGAPALARTLYLVAAAKRDPFHHEPAITTIIRDALRLLTDLLGPLAVPADS